MTHVFACAVCGTDNELNDAHQSVIEMTCWDCGAVMEVNRFRMEVLRVVEQP